MPGMTYQAVKLSLSTTIGLRDQYVGYSAEHGVPSPHFSQMPSNSPAWMCARVAPETICRGMQNEEVPFRRCRRSPPSASPPPPRPPISARAATTGRRPMPRRSTPGPASISAPMLAAPSPAATVSTASCSPTMTRACSAACRPASTGSSPAILWSARKASTAGSARTTSTRCSPPASSTTTTSARSPPSPPASATRSVRRWSM